MQTEIIDLAKKQEELMKEIMILKQEDNSIENRMNNLKKQPHQKTITKIVKIQSKKHNKFVASKLGKNFHMPTCPFVKNVKPKSQIIFKSKNAALNKGYKPCTCIK
jgi:regulator of replication initiation timing